MGQCGSHPDRVDKKASRKREKESAGRGGAGGTPKISGSQSSKPDTVLYGMTYRQRCGLARKTHFTVKEIEVLCKHFSDISASQEDDGVIDKGEWEGAFKNHANLSTSDSGMRRQVSHDAGIPVRKSTVSAALVQDSFENLPKMFVDRMFKLFDGVCSWRRVCVCVCVCVCGEGRAIFECATRTGR